MANEQILVLEDHADLQREIRNVLVEAGYRVQTTDTGADAIALARRTPFDLILADIFLPDISGIQVFHQIRAILPEIAGVVLTGHSTWELALDALRAGFVAFLVKPIVPEQILATIISSLEQEKLRRENVRLRALVPLYELSRAFMETVELHHLLNQIVTSVKHETQSEVVSIMLLNDDRSELNIAAAAGLPPDVVEKQKRIIGSGIAGYVAKTGLPLIVAEDTALDPSVRDAMTKPDLVSALSLPLRLRGQVIGVVNLSRMRGSEPFSRVDLELATVFAGQAAIAIDKARLINQLRQLNEISQRLAGASNLEEACNVILSAPIEMLNARGTALALDTGGTQATVRTRGLENSVLPIQSKLISTDAFQADENGSWLTVPLRHGEKTLGTLTVRLPSVNLPSEEHLGTLHTIANVAGAVIESHRLRAREAQAFREVDRAIRSDLNLQDLLNRLLTEMVGTCEADGGAIFMWNDERGCLEPWVTQGISVDAALADSIIQNPSAQLINRPAAAQSIIAAPMSTGHRLEGAAILARAHTSGKFSSSHVDLLSTLTSAGALVIRNAQLYARSEEAAIAEERTRIARELHDGLAQDLSYLVMKISVAQRFITQGKERELKKELQDISDQIRRDARDVRRIIYALRPLEIETLGFLPALRRFVKDFGTVNEIETALNILGDANRLSPKIETALFRLVQETLNNIRKHAQATHVYINLNLENPTMLTLCVRDDGTGFELAPALQAARERGSVGLVQMRERAERAGGKFEIETTPGKGTSIQVELPTREM